MPAIEEPLLGNENTPVRVAYGSHGGGSLPIWAAYRTGVLERLGVTAELSLISGSVSVVQALLAGSVQYANIASPAVLAANVAVEGAELVYLAGAMHHLSQQLISQPGIEKVADLRGLKVGARVSTDERIPDLESMLWHYLLPRYGLDPATDVEYVVVRSHPDLVDAICEGRVAAGLVVPPHAFDAQRRGLRMLLDGASLGPPFQLGGLVATRRQITNNPELTAAIVAAYVEGVRLVKSDHGLIRELLRDYALVDNEDVLNQTAEFFQRDFAYPPFTSVAGLDTVLKSLAAQLPGAVGADPLDYVDSSFIDAYLRSRPPERRGEELGPAVRKPADTENDVAGRPSTERAAAHE